MHLFSTTIVDDLCKKLQDYSKKSRCWLGIFNKTEQEEMIDQVKKLRTPQFAEKK
jgi:hypothetical protein